MLAKGDDCIKVAIDRMFVLLVATFFVWFEEWGREFVVSTIKVTIWGKNGAKGENIACNVTFVTRFSLMLHDAI